jgi:DNA-directed RNA polymerase subunit omega
MLIYPSIDSLMRKVDSKYALVVAAAKRARELQDTQNKPQEGVRPKKPVTLALEEIDTGIITYTYQEKKEG